LIVLALLAMGPVLLNGWIQDEHPLLRLDPRIQEISGLWSGFVEPWWPPPSTSGLYRPAARTLATLQALVGAGGPFIFKLGSLLCYLAAVGGVWALARRCFTPLLAWTAAALFAVHPVHTEAVAVAVNQGESLVTALAAYLSALWIDRERTGADRPIGPLLLLGFALALGFKEHALVIPALFLAALLLVPDAAGRWRSRGRALLMLAAVGALFWAARTAVLGDLAGADPAEGLADAGFVPRALTMLGVVPEWARLLLVPAHLQTSYAPNEILPWNGWTSAQTIGVLLLVAVGGLVAWSWRRRPVVAFGLLWTAVALFPVSNLVLPTGILLAERTLMLASVGAVIALVGALPEERWSGTRVFQLGVGVLLLLGVIRSASRFPDFRDSSRYAAAMGRDAPDSWQSQLLLGLRSLDQGDRAGGEHHLRRAIAIHPRNTRAYRALARRYRLDGLCAPAIPLYRQVTVLEPIDQFSRLSLVACLLDRGAYAEAASVAREGAAGPGPALRAAFTTAIEVADGAARATPPAGTVRLPPFEGDHTTVGTGAPPR
jgi:hypothetical protein